MSVVLNLVIPLRLSSKVMRMMISITTVVAATVPTMNVAWCHSLPQPRRHGPLWSDSQRPHVPALLCQRHPRGVRMLLDRNPSLLLRSRGLLAPQGQPEIALLLVLFMLSPRHHPPFHRHIVDRLPLAGIRSQCSIMPRARLPHHCCSQTLSRWLFHSKRRILRQYLMCRVVMDTLIWYCWPSD